MPDSAGTMLLREQLQRWIAAGLIDADQAGRIEAAEVARAHAQPQSARRLPLVAEVLGYLGAVLAATAIAVALRHVWTHVPPAAWLTLASVLAVAFLIAGALIRPDGEPAFARLRSVLWLLATAGAAGFVAVLTTKFLHLGNSSVAVSVAGMWLICAIPLWWRTRSAVQQVAAFGGAIALVETGLDRFDPHAGTLTYGLALWALAAVWGAATARGYLLPRVTGLVISGVGALTGALIAMTSDNAAGQVLALLTVAGLLTAGVVARRVLLIGIGATGTLYVIPAVAARYLPGSLAAPLAVAMVGLVLLGVAMWLARHRRTRV
jgi:Predicted membrane protein (DUF2157)